MALSLATGLLGQEISPTNAPLPPGVTEDLYRDVSGQLRCPTCTGLSVLDSEAAFSVQIRNEVKEQLGRGKSEKEVLKFFVDRYGPWILRAPPMEGVNALAWFVPVAFLILGPILIWFFIGRKRATAASSERMRRLETVRSTDEIVEEMKIQLAQLLDAKRAGGK